MVAGRPSSGILDGDATLREDRCRRGHEAESEDRGNECRWDERTPTAHRRNTSTTMSSEGAVVPHDSMMTH